MKKFVFFFSEDSLLHSIEISAIGYYLYAIGDVILYDGRILDEDYSLTLKHFFKKKKIIKNDPNFEI